MNCCAGALGLFVQQDSEYGICYTFNSVLNSIGKARYVIYFDLDLFPIRCHISLL